LDRFIRGRQVSAFRERIWHQRCCLRARGQRRGAGGSAKGEFQKVTAFHDISSFVIHEWMRVSSQPDECSLNRAFRCRRHKTFRVLARHRELKPEPEPSSTNNVAV
jgi:hypothetical protein